MRAVKEEPDHEYEVPLGLDSKASSPAPQMQEIQHISDLSDPRSPAV